MTTSHAIRFLNPRKRAKSVGYLCLALAALLFAAPAIGQLTGRLAGQVADAEGAVLPGVNVTIQSPNLMGTRTEFTNVDGRYSFPGLPPGIYIVNAELDGFVNQQRTEVEVRLNGVTEIHFSMPSGEFAEEVVVVAETPMVDPEQVSTSYNYNTEYLKKAAVGSSYRSYQAVLGQAPGVSGGSNPSVFGSTMGENAYFIDGVDSTDPVTATFGVNLTYDALAAVDFETGGFESRFGRATGGVVNVVTKSGGNEFSGSFDLRYRDHTFNTDGEHFKKGQDVSEYRNPSFTLGGPFKRNKLWFFGAISPVVSKSTPTESVLTRTTKANGFLGKISWQANESWHLAARYINEDTTFENTNASRFIGPEAAGYMEQPAGISSIEALAVPSAKFQWFVKLGVMRSTLNIFPQDRDFETVGWSDRRTGRSGGNFTVSQWTDRDRDDLSTSITFLGSKKHELRAGVEYVDMFFDGRSNIVGGFLMSNQDGEPYILYHSPVLPNLEYTGDLLVGHVQDTWRATDDLTLKIGIRTDQIAFENDAGYEVAALDKLQPRLGLAWDITGNSMTVLRANWARAMHPSALTLPYFARSRLSPTVLYLSCSTLALRFRGVDPEDCEAANPGRIMAGGHDLPRWRPGPDTEFEPYGWFLLRAYGTDHSFVQDGLKPTYADTRMLGVEREIARRTSIGLTYVEKETSDIFEDTCNGNVPEPTANGECTHFVMLNMDVLARDYDAFILDFESRYSSRFHIRSSWTYSSTRGNVGYTQNAGSDFDLYPEHFENRYGYMDLKHRFKLHGYVDLPLEFTLGFVGTWTSPFRYSKTEANDPPSYGDRFVDPRGSHEANDLYWLDIELRRGFRFGDNKRLELIGTAYNLLDDEHVTGVCGRASNCDDIDFGQPTSYGQPRRFEVGLRFEF